MLCGLRRPRPGGRNVGQVSPPKRGRAGASPLLRDRGLRDPPQLGAKRATPWQGLRGDGRGRGAPRRDAIPASLTVPAPPAACSSRPCSSPHGPHRTSAAQVPTATGRQRGPRACASAASGGRHVTHVRTFGRRARALWLRPACACVRGARLPTAVSRERGACAAGRSPARRSREGARPARARLRRPWARAALSSLLSNALRGADRRHKMAARGAPGAAAAPAASG